MITAHYGKKAAYRPRADQTNVVSDTQRARRAQKPEMVKASNLRRRVFART